MVTIVVDFMTRLLSRPQQALLPEAHAWGVFCFPHTKERHVSKPTVCVREKNVLASFESGGRSDSKRFGEQFQPLSLFGGIASWTKRRKRKHIHERLEVTIRWPSGLCFVKRLSRMT